MTKFAKSEPKHWFDLEDAFGGTWSVFLGDSESIPQLGIDYGVTINERHLVGIDNNQPDDIKMMTALHEALHVCVSSPGDVHLLAKALGCEPSQVSEKEETWVSFVAPRLFALLQRNGLLKLPRLPK